MLRIAHPHLVVPELRNLIDYCSSDSPSRAKLAADLEDLSNRVAGSSDNEQWFETLTKAQNKFCEDTLKILIKKLGVGGRIEGSRAGAASAILPPDDRVGIFFKIDFETVRFKFTGFRELEGTANARDHSPTSLAEFMIGKTISKFTSGT